MTDVAKKRNKYSHHANEALSELAAFDFPSPAALLGRTLGLSESRVSFGSLGPSSVLPSRRASNPSGTRSSGIALLFRRPTVERRRPEGPERANLLVS